MRYCLECRHLCADGPRCSSCGRSFLGRLCNSRRPHLSPPNANFCQQCGSTTLTDAANYIPLSWLSKLLVASGLILLVLIAGPFLLSLLTGGMGNGHYRSPMVWFFETCGRVLVPLVSIVVVLYGFSAFLPGDAGKSMRRAIDGVVRWMAHGTLRFLQWGISALAKLLLHWLGGGGVPR